MEHKQLVNTLNDLIENCKDGESGFRSTAEHASSEGLKQVFLARAEDCRHAALELQDLVNRLGGDSVDGGTVAGAVHRGWVAVKGTLTGYSDLNMLEDTERGEAAAVSRYQDALQRNLPMEVRGMVQRQYEGAKRNHLQIRGLLEQARRREHAMEGE